jgi:geranylgeranyl reductase family protein
MNVALIDRCEFPGEKLCGGLLSGRTRSVFEDVFGGPWGPGVECTAAGVRFIHKGRELNSVDTPYPVYLASRKEFDAHLFGLTVKKGPDILLGRAVASVDTRETRVLFRNGDPIRADYIIGADGVTSKVARSLFQERFRKHAYGLCFQAELPRDSRDGERTVPEIHLGYVRWGYAWVFPKGKTLSVGLGGLLRKNGDMRSLFLRFHEQAAGTQPSSVRSAYIPAGNFRKRPGKGNVLLTGDAAGLVEPITGEGIAYALLSGKYAAQSVLQAARAGDPGRAYGFYLPRYRGIVQEFSIAKLLRHLMSSRLAEPMFIRELPNAGGIIEQYMALIAGQTTHAHLARLVLSKIARDILTILTPGRRQCLRTPYPRR